MAEKKTINIDVVINSEESVRKLKELRTALKQTAAGSEDFKRISQAIKDTEDSLEEAKVGAKGFLDQLEDAPGPIGALFQGLRKVEIATKSFGAALKATGIGLIVAAVGGLVAAFANVEGATKKLEPILIGFERILGGIFAALEPLIDSFVELALDALPYVTKGIQVFYSSLVGLFTLVKEAGVGVGKILKGIFTLDTNSIKEGWDQLKGGWSKTVDAYNASSERFEAGTKKLTKTEKENLKERNEALKKAAEEAARIREEELKKITEGEEEAMKTLLSAREKEEYEVNQKYANLIYLAVKYNKDTKTLKEAQAKELSDIDKKYKEEEEKREKDFNQKIEEIKIGAVKDEIDRTIQQRQSKYQRELAELEADKEFIKKSETEKNEIRKNLAQGLENDLEKIRVDARVKELDAQLKIDEAKLKVLQEDTPAYFEQQRKIEDDAYQAQKLAAKDNAQQLEAIEINHKANLKNIDDAEFQAKKDLQLQIVNLYGGFGRALQELAGKNKKLAIAGLLIEQAAGVATIIINTQKAAAKAGYFTPLGIATLIAGAASVAAAVVATVKGIQKINEVQTPGGGGGGGTSAGGANVALPTVSRAAAPQIQTAGGANPTTQIGETIAAAQKPIKAYVVSGEVSSQVALDRRTSRAATFAGG